MIFSVIAMQSHRAYAQADSKDSTGVIDPGSEEVIEDPELAGRAAVTTAPAPPPASFRIELHTRTGVDTRWENDREEFVESTQIAIFEASYQRSEDLSFVAGVRARYHFGRRRNEAGLGSANRYELDMAPTAGYADASLADGLHVRAGYQMISLGRFDFWSATNVLAMLDLRNGPTTMPEASEVAQPALRSDLDITSGLTLQAFYVPFFQPHLVTIVGTDYALLKVLETEASGDLVQTVLSRAVERSQLAAVTSDGMRALAPQPSPEHPQGALRLTARSEAGELALTAGTALERLPAFELNRELEAFLLEPGPGTALGAVLSDKPIRVVHNRFTVLALDGATDIGPVQLGLETAYMQNRTFYAARPGAIPQPGSSDVGHAATRLELAESDFVTSIEAFAAYAFDEPADPERRWQLLEGGRWLRGVAAAVHWALPQTGLALDLFGMVSVGPTYFVAPRLEWEALDRFYLELGAFFFEGRSRTGFGDPEISIGSVYDDADQVFVGARFLP